MRSRTVRRPASRGARHALLAAHRLRELRAPREFFELGFPGHRRGSVASQPVIPNGSVPQCPARDLAPLMKLLVLDCASSAPAARASSSCGECGERGDRERDRAGLRHGLGRRLRHEVLGDRSPRVLDPAAAGDDVLDQREALASGEVGREFELQEPAPIADRLEAQAAVGASDTDREHAAALRARRLAPGLVDDRRLHRRDHPLEADLHVLVRPQPSGSPAGSHTSIGIRMRSLGVPIRSIDCRAPSGRSGWLGL